jgi:hypothetical protein
MQGISILPKQLNNRNLNLSIPMSSTYERNVVAFTHGMYPGVRTGPLPSDKIEAKIRYAQSGSTSIHDRAHRHTNSFLLEGPP